MSLYRITRRVYCEGRLYEPGELCDEKTALMLPDECELAEQKKKEEEQEAKKTKPVKKLAIK